MKMQPNFCELFRKIKYIFEKLFQAEEEARNLQKKIQTVENDLDQTQEALTQVNTKLEEKNKNLQNVSTFFFRNT